MKMNLTLLEYALAALGLAAMALSTWGYWSAWREREALITARTNGALFAIATRHLFTSFLRFLAGLFSCAGGLWLVTMTNDSSEPAVLAKHVWLFLCLVLVITMVQERWMARYVKDISNAKPEERKHR